MVAKRVRKQSLGPVVAGRVAILLREMRKAAVGEDLPEGELPGCIGRWRRMPEGFCLDSFAAQALPDLDSSTRRNAPAFAYGAGLRYSAKGAHYVRMDGPTDPPEIISEYNRRSKTEDTDEPEDPITERDEPDLAGVLSGFRDASVCLLTAVTTLRRQIAELHQQVAELTDERAVLRAEVERLTAELNTIVSKAQAVAANAVQAGFAELLGNPTEAPA